MNYIEIDMTFDEPLDMTYIRLIRSKTYKLVKINNDALE
jgi:hypothetical protein